MWSKCTVVDEVCQWENGATFTPMATFSDGYSGRLQIAVDDYQFVIGIRVGESPRPERYRFAIWIPPEVVNEMAELKTTLKL